LITCPEHLETQNVRSREQSHIPVMQDGIAVWDVDFVLEECFPARLENRAFAGI
jgi:hypothetical protein